MSDWNSENGNGRWRLQPESAVHIEEPARHFKYATRINAAKQWLGDRYLLAKPVNKRIKNA